MSMRIPSLEPQTPAVEKTLAQRLDAVCEVVDSLLADWVPEEV